ncbi:SCO family protein [Aurantivibrio plasticivorans]
MNQQKRNITLTVAAVCGFIAILVGLFTYTMMQPRILSVKELVGLGVITYQEPKAINDFELVAHTGTPFTKESLKGQWTLLFFGFSSCPGFCPATLAILNAMDAQLEPEIKEQTQVVMVSVDPARDTPEALAAYMPKFNQAFVGVTGDFLTIKRLSNQFHIGFQKEAGADENYNVDHGEQIVLIDPNGDYYGFFKPPFTIGQLKTGYQSIVKSYDR